MNPATIKAAIEILTTESNQLAHLLDTKAFASMNYRVEIAVRREMESLRDVARDLRRYLPAEDET